MRLTVTFAALSALLAAPAMAQPLGTGSLAEKMSVFDWMHGEWRGEATVYSPQGVQTLTHTERVGPMLKGDVLAVEGLAYEEDGSIGFNAFGIISYDPRADAYEIRAYTGGNAGTYPIIVTETGYEWTIPIGPEMRVDYVAVIDGDSWTETGTFVRGEQSFPTVSFTVTRIGETDWPAAGQVTAE
ncbi:DUF1579 domain-containing protein [Parvularcula marina]|uniref:DUF1579 domain-containing protein n=1 Tax=Parvularcula marina TaxID=2292771 RepID=A0A371RGV6_9PROT|nr:DUF1579 domain-containing protein [Parvularcula marina]RFB04687.1 DUF1579 domain-containing protein [Parvularcula marina]